MLLISAGSNSFVAADFFSPEIEGIYSRTCHHCHGDDAFNAPRLGDYDSWDGVIDRSLENLVHSIRYGLGSMPPMGMCGDCSDDDFRQLIQYMVVKSDYPENIFDAPVKEKVDKLKAQNVTVLPEQTEDLLALLPVAESMNPDALALIISNEDYELKSANAGNLTFTKLNASAMYHYVRQSLGFSEENVIYYHNVTRQQMLGIFGNEKTPNGLLAEKIIPHKTDVFIFYSGLVESGKEDYFIPVDKLPEAAAVDGYSINLLYGNLNKLNVSSVTLLIDGKANGLEAQKTRQEHSVNGIHYSSLYAVFNPADGAMVDKDFKLGVFTKDFLINIISLNGIAKHMR